MWNDGLFCVSLIHFVVIRSGQNKERTTKKTQQIVVSVRPDHNNAGCLLAVKLLTWLWHRNLNKFEFNAKWNKIIHSLPSAELAFAVWC